MNRWATGAAMASAAGLAAYVWRHRDAELRAIRARPTGDAIVVFGASVHVDGPSGELRARLDHALGLWRAGAATEIIVSGGVDRGVDEVQVMADYLINQGVPPEAVTPGRPGHNTRATVAAMVDLARGRYIAVSSPYHCYRIEAESRRRGLDVVMAAPVSTPETDRPRSHAVRFATDMAGSAWYALPADLTTRVDVGRIRHGVPQLLSGTRLPPRDPESAAADPTADETAVPTPLGPGRLHVPAGHHYSPLPSSDDVDRALRRGTQAGRALPGIDLREAEQMSLLASWQSRYDELDLPVEPGAGRFHYDNTWFTYADAISYALMLRHLTPRRVVEVGSGFSSALALDVAERFLDPPPDFTFIDPDPQRLSELARPGELHGRLVAAPVQDVDPQIFASLGPGDILFIDSSHVLKAGSDLQVLFDEILPVLPAGVHIHFHDVFYPFEYPQSWLSRGTAMNEAYAVRLLLTGGDRYRILLFNSFLTRFHADWFAEHMPLFLAGDFPTGGIWLERR